MKHTILLFFCRRFGLIKNVIAAFGSIRTDLKTYSDLKTSSEEFSWVEFNFER